MFTCRLILKCDSTRAETRFRLSTKRTNPFKSAGASVLSTTGSRGVRISGSNAGYSMFRGSVKGTGYPLHSPVSPSLPLPCVTVCHHISTGLYKFKGGRTQIASPSAPTSLQWWLWLWCFCVGIYWDHAHEIWLPSLHTRWYVVTGGWSLMGRVCPEDHWLNGTAVFS